MQLYFEASEAVMFSYLKDGVFLKSYTKWEPKFLEFKSLNGKGLMYAFSTNQSGQSCIVFDITNASLIRIELVDLEDTDSKEITKIENRIGMKCKCSLKDGLPTYFRFVISSQSQFDRVYNAFKETSTHSIDAPNVINVPQVPSLTRTGTSSFRRLDLISKAEAKSMRDSILSRRGAFIWMPVPGFFANDLVHGAWWFLVGSFLMCSIAVLVVVNNYHDFISTDDSVLSRIAYRATWGLLFVSGFFYTLGSFAFLRAMSEPPMQPLFSWYHLCTDELVASWMFFWGTVPAVPYCCIFLDMERSVLYVGMLVVSIAALAGCYLFVLACYPEKQQQEDEGMRKRIDADTGSGRVDALPLSAQAERGGSSAPQLSRSASLKLLDGPQGALPQQAYMHRVIVFMCCLPSPASSSDSTAEAKRKGCLHRIVHVHLVNDWLAGCWCVFWASLLSFLGVIVVTIATYYRSTPITVFVNISSAIDCLLFVVGSVYFVSASSTSAASADIEIGSPVSPPDLHIHLQTPPPATSHPEQQLAVSSPIISLSQDPAQPSRVQA